MFIINLLNALYHHIIIIIDRHSIWNNFMNEIFALLSLLVSIFMLGAFIREGFLWTEMDSGFFYII
jgi:hypothetical protein